MSKFCTQTCMPCPEPIPGKGRGESMCEQNGVCQRVSLDDIPRVDIKVAPDNTIEIQVEQKRIGEAVKP